MVRSMAAMKRRDFLHFLGGACYGGLVIGAARGVNILANPPAKGEVEWTQVGTSNEVPVDVIKLSDLKKLVNGLKDRSTTDEHYVFVPKATMEMLSKEQEDLGIRTRWGRLENVRFIETPHIHERRHYPHKRRYYPSGRKA